MEIEDESNGDLYDNPQKVSESLKENVAQEDIVELGEDREQQMRLL